MKGFSRAIRDGETDKVEEKLEKIVQGNLNKEVWKGYNWALKGMIEALDSDDDLSLVRQIANDEVELEKLKKLKEGMAERASQEFRPEYEQGYNSAWSDVLTVIIEDAEE